MRTDLQLCNGLEFGQSMELGYPASNSNKITDAGREPGKHKKTLGALRVAVLVRVFFLDEKTSQLTGFLKRAHDNGFDINLDSGQRAAGR